MKNTFGSDLSLTIFGESHGQAIGAVLDGMAAGTACPLLAPRQTPCSFCPA